MGYPVGYEAISPMKFFGALSVAFTRYLITCVSAYLGLSRFVQINHIGNTARACFYPKITKDLIQKLLQVVKYKELEIVGDPMETCAVCLSEFEEEVEIWLLKKCKHIFHGACLNRWMEHNKDSCPLCRMSFVPLEVRS